MLFKYKFNSTSTKEHPLKMSTTATANKTTETIIQTASKPETAPKYKSWAVMAYEADEEERLEREEEEREKMQKIMEERRYLHSIGEYELEEGEILE
jgi:hypothetical protein